MIGHYNELLFQLSVSKIKSVKSISILSKLLVKRFSGLHKEQSFISLISFKNEPNEICRNLIEKGPKDGFFAPDKIKNHTCEKKEKRNRNSEEGEKRRREKSNGSTLSFTLSTFGVFGQIYCLKDEFYLALAFSEN